VDFPIENGEFPGVCNNLPEGKSQILVGEIGPGPQLLRLFPLGIAAFPSPRQLDM
jgi:hypothetical protein